MKTGVQFGQYIAVENFSSCSSKSGFPSPGLQCTGGCGGWSGGRGQSLVLWAMLAMGLGNWAGVGWEMQLGWVRGEERPFPHGPCTSTPCGSSSFPTPIPFLPVPFPFFPLCPFLPIPMFLFYPSFPSLLTPFLPFLLPFPFLFHLSLHFSSFPSSPSLSSFPPSSSFSSPSPCLSPSPFPSSPSSLP